jgi:hypothetical protein
MIGGLIIEASSPATVLIHARGPSMSGAPFLCQVLWPIPFCRFFPVRTSLHERQLAVCALLQWLCLWHGGPDRSHGLRFLPTQSGANNISSELYPGVRDSDHFAAGSLYCDCQRSRRWNRRGLGRGFRDGLKNSRSSCLSPYPVRRVRHNTAFYNMD